MSYVNEATVCGLKIRVVKNYYDGLWYIRYVDGGDWAGPYRTRKEARERLDKEKTQE